MRRCCGRETPIYRFDPRQPRLGEIVRLDPALDAIVTANTQVEKLAEGFQFLEGPVWVREDGYGSLAISTPT
jgi:hypothetical protein